MWISFNFPPRAWSWVDQIIGCKIQKWGKKWAAWGERGIGWMRRMPRAFCCNFFHIPHWIRTLAFKDVHSFPQSLLIESIPGNQPPGTCLSSIAPLPPSWVILDKFLTFVCLGFYFCKNKNNYPSCPGLGVRIKCWKRSCQSPWPAVTEAVIFGKWRMVMCTYWFCHLGQVISSISQVPHL